jgi:hypothetical protein
LVQHWTASQTSRNSIANIDINSHGNQGTLDTAAKGTLEAEFGSSKEEDVIIKILEKGNIIESEVRLSLSASVYLSFIEHQLTPMSRTLAVTVSRTSAAAAPLPTRYTHTMTSKEDEHLR